MAKANGEQRLVQRRVTTGDVIVVQQVLRRPDPMASPRVRPEEAAPAELRTGAPAEPALAAEAEVGGTEESYRWWEQEEVEAVPAAAEVAAEGVMVEAGRSWPYTPAPEGYAYEFGTGRLIKITE